MKLIIANWKAYITDSKKATDLVGAVSKTKIKKSAEVVICPPFIYLSFVVSCSAFAKASADKQSSVKLGVQDVFWEESGAYTGEITTAMLGKFGVKYAIVGHSERRNRLGETDEMINKKLKHVLESGLTAILCVGEREREDRKAVPEIVAEQVRADLAGVPPPFIKKLVVAYEPIWAIGTGVADTPDDALSAALYIRKTVADIYGAKIASSLRVLYGGSVNSQNAPSFINQDGLEGLLVGKSSADKKEFLEILKNL